MHLTRIQLEIESQREINDMIDNNTIPEVRPCADLRVSDVAGPPPRAQGSKALFPHSATARSL